MAKMALAARLFGGTCFLCRGAAAGLLCEGCVADLPALASPRCPKCALPSPQGETCGRCLARPPSYDATVAALAYGFPADALVHALKFRGELALAPLLGALLARAVADANQPAVHWIVPVPLSAERLKSRGFNQSIEISRGLARVDSHLVQRARDTAPQFDLPWAERQRNVRGAFSVARLVEGLSIAVVDDVMTTGATLDELARTLKAAGARRVVNWVVARTPAPE
ncbi:MAG TPA: ComF family protein [Burkholderiales bacterium]|nr:ComF family protein [Burkholderiales bacterium]